MYVETCNREEIPFSSRIVSRSMSVSERPYTALHNAAHLYSDQANPFCIADLTRYKVPRGWVQDPQPVHSKWVVIEIHWESDKQAGHQSKCGSKVAANDKCVPSEPASDKLLIDKWPLPVAPFLV